jgi:hypothetical protein
MKLKFLYIFFKSLNGLVVKTLVLLHEVLGFNLDECVH